MKTNMNYGSEASYPPVLSPNITYLWTRTRFGKIFQISIHKQEMIYLDIEICHPGGIQVNLINKKKKSPPRGRDFII